MPVNSTHPDYDAAYPKWRKCRDAYAGSDAVKHACLESAGRMSGPVIIDGRPEYPASYLPVLDGMEADQYHAYVTRALWYGATKRTVQGLTGAVFRKDAHVAAPEKIEPHLDDITMDGDVTLPELAKKLLEELLVIGRVGLLVDMASDAVAAPARRPYWVPYKAEQIINWSTRRVKGQMVLAMVVLQEEVETPGDDPFVSECQTQWRVLKLDADNLYAIEIWKKVESGSDPAKKTITYELDETIAPTNKGKRLDFIPFCFIGPNGMTSSIETPPLLDLIDVNFSHFRSSADYEHGLHYAALPTPWATGFDPDSDLKIGPSTVWISNNPEGKVGMLEFTGQGLKPIADAIKEKEQKMAALGARLLETQGRSGVEAAETIRLRQSGEQGALHSIAATLSQALTKVLQWHAAWSGVTPDDVTRVDVNNDFYDADMPPLLFQALIGALQSELISYETFYYNLQKGDVARPGITADEERQLITANSSATGMPVAAGPE